MDICSYASMLGTIHWTTIEYAVKVSWLVCCHCGHAAAVLKARPDCQGSRLHFCHRQQSSFIICGLVGRPQRGFRLELYCSKAEYWSDIQHPREYPALESAPCMQPASATSALTPSHPTQSPFLPYFYPYRVFCHSLVPPRFNYSSAVYTPESHLKYDMLIVPGITCPS